MPHVIFEGTGIALSKEDPGLSSAGHIVFQAFLLVVGLCCSEKLLVWCLHGHPACVGVP